MPPAKRLNSDAHPPDIVPILSRLKAAARTGSRDYRGAATVAANLSRELRIVGRLEADAMVEVLECGIKLIEKAFDTVDDSNGILGDLIRQLQQDHADVCEHSDLDRRKLGARLAKWALRSDWEVFLDSPKSHAEALGEVGLEGFEAEVDKHFKLLRPLGPGESDERGGKISSFNVTYLKTLLAARHGIDAVVEVMARDLSSPYHYLLIAQVLAESGRDTEALSWLERGQGGEFDRRHDRRLDDLAADLHFRAGRFEIATEMATARFEESPSAELFDRLRHFATESNDWPDRRVAAIARLRALPNAPALDVELGLRSDPTGHSELVKILLAEGDIEAAWNAAEFGGCTSRVWAELAEARGLEHPADSMRVFQLLAIRALVETDRRAYRSGAALIQRAHRFAEAADLAEQSRTWILGIREANRRRPILQTEFDRYRLPRLGANPAGRGSAAI